MASPWQHSFILDNPDATARLGAQLATILKPGDVLALHGDLGAGKTTLARAVITSFMAVSTQVPSPTFTLAQHYATQRGTIWHFDLYRIKQADEIFELGWDDALADGIVLVEWPEHAAPYIPATALHCALSVVDNGRTATFSGHESWTNRLRAIF